MSKIAFIGFGEVNTPIDLLIKKCSSAKEALEAEGLSLTAVYPVTDDYEEKDIAKALQVLSGDTYDAVVICIAGWIPTHAVIKITEHYRHLPMVLWGLAGWYEEGRLVTTADQAGTSALRATMDKLGYTFRYLYDIVGLPTKSSEVASYCRAASAARRLRSARIGMAGYRDMNLYGTLYDGTSLKRVIGPEIETFEMLEMVQRRETLTDEAIDTVVSEEMGKWHFVKPAAEEGKRAAAAWFLTIDQLVKERGYEAISLKDVDGMKKLLGYPPAPVFMLLSDVDDVCTVPENDCLGAVTQLMVKYLTDQPAAYLEFYEFFTDRVLAGVPDFVPSGIVEGETTVMPAAFGELSEGILNVSKVKTGMLTMCRLFEKNGQYGMHLVYGEGVTPRHWEEAGWTQPAPQLPGLEILLPNTDAFAQNVMCQHYIISYGDNRRIIRDLCDILGIAVYEDGSR